MSQIPQRHFPKDRLSQQGKTSLHDRELLEPNIDIGELQIKPSQVENWPSTEGGTHGLRPQNWCDFFYLFYGVFPKQKCFYFENICEMKVFSKRKQNCFCFWNENILICEQKWKCFRNEFKFIWNENVFNNKTFAKRKWFVLVFETFFSSKNARNKSCLGWHGWATTLLIFFV